MAPSERRAAVFFGSLLPVIGFRTHSGLCMLLSIQGRAQPAAGPGRRAAPGWGRCSVKPAPFRYRTSFPNQTAHDPSPHGKRWRTVYLKRRSYVKDYFLEHLRPVNGGGRNPLPSNGRMARLHHVRRSPSPSHAFGAGPFSPRYRGARYSKSAAVGTCAIHGSRNKPGMTRIGCAIPLARHT